MFEIAQVCADEDGVLEHRIFRYLFKQIPENSKISIVCEGSCFENEPQSFPQSTKDIQLRCFSKKNKNLS